MAYYSLEEGLDLTLLNTKELFRSLSNNYPIFVLATITFASYLYWFEKKLIKKIVEGKYWEKELKMNLNQLFYDQETVQAIDIGAGVYRKKIVENSVSYQGFGPDVNTIHAVLTSICEKYREHSALGTREVIKKESHFVPELNRTETKLTLGEYKWRSYSSCKTMIDQFAHGINTLIDRHTNIDENKHILIYSNTCEEWFLSAHACFLLSKTPLVTSYANLGLDALKYTIQQTKTCVVIVEYDLLDVMIPLLQQFPFIQSLVVIGPHITTDDFEQHRKNITTGSKLYIWSEIISFGRYILSRNVGDLNEVSLSDVERLPHLSQLSVTEIRNRLNITISGPGDLAVIMYTSGTTGDPKGVMILHRQVVGALTCIRPCFNGFSVEQGQDVYIAYLPLAHVLELVAETAIVSFGIRLGFSSPGTLTDNSIKIKSGCRGDLAVLKPTLFACVPAVLEKIKKEILDKVNNMPFHRRWIFCKLLANRIEKVKAKENPYSQNFIESFVFNKVKEALGGNLRGLLCGGAALNPETQCWFIAAFGIPTVNAMAATETCGTGCMASGYDLSLGRVGPPKYNVEVFLRDWEEGGYFVSDKDDPKIGVPRGEIVFRSPAVTNGYYMNPKATKDSFIIDSKAGCNTFFTGDIGKIDVDGVLTIIDRKKDLVKLSGGEYISLGKIESLISESVLVEQCCIVVNPLKHYPIVIIVPRKQRFLEYICASSEAKNLTVFPYDELCKDDCARKLLLVMIQELLKPKRLAHFEIPQRVILYPFLFTPENNLTTVSLKLRRANISKYFKEEIEKAYQ